MGEYKTYVVGFTIYDPSPPRSEKKSVRVRTRNEAKLEIENKLIQRKQEGKICHYTIDFVKTYEEYQKEPRVISKKP